MFLLLHLFLFEMFSRVQVHSLEELLTSSGLSDKLGAFEDYGVETVNKQRGRESAFVSIITQLNGKLV